MSDDCETETESKAEGWGCALAWIVLAVAFALMIAVDPVVTIIHAVQGR